MPGQKFSLTFTKRVEKRVLEPSAIRNETRVESSIPAPQTLHAIEGKSLQIDESESEKRELVIPLVQDDRAALLKQAQMLVEAVTLPGTKKLKTGEGEPSGNDDCGENKRGGGETEEMKKPLSLDEQAATALIEESQRKLESWQERDKESSLTIPASTSASNLKDSQPTITKAKEATLDDYEEIPVSSFGAAMLRGMGWKKDEGVGRIGKRVVEVIDPAALTFTLAGSRKRRGLEARDTGFNNNTQKTGQEEELMPVVKGAHIFIHSGRQKGTYGVIQTVDEDHVLLKAAVSGNIIREVELNLRVVTQHEFKESSRVINKDMYDRYKEEEARKKSEHKKKKSKSSDSSDGRRKGSSERDTKHSESPDQSTQDIDRQEETTKQENTPRHKFDTEDKALEKGTRDHDREEKHRDRIRGTDEQREFRRYGDENAEKGSASRDKGEKFYAKGSKSKQHMDFMRDDDRHSVRRNGDEKPDDRDRKYIDNGDSERKLKEGRERDWEHGYSKLKGRRDWEEEQQGRDGKSKERREREEEYVHIKSKGREKESHSKMKVQREREEYEYGSTKSSTTKRGREERYYKEKEKRVERKVVVEEVRQVQQEQPSMAVPWVRENLRVRLISRTYRGGKHHKEKVVVRSVVTAERCECETEDGTLLMEVHPAWLETVIPKVPPHLVMIVRGDNKGQCARILQLHKDQEKASIQLLEEETTLLKLHYDDICEYVGR